MAKKSIEVKTTFRLNAPELIGLIDDRYRRSVMRLGGFIRLTAMRSMRPVHKLTGKPSNPGEPPKSRLGLVRQLMEFAYDTRTKQMVVGPKVSRRKGDKVVPTWGLGVPNLLEFGGQLTVGPQGWWIGQFTGRGKKLKFVEGSGVDLEPGTVMQFEARPYMAPALKKAVESEKLKSYWEAIT